MIVKNSLLNSDYIIYQNDDWFKFSLDSVLLANFVSLNLRCKRIMDLACGNGAISMLLSLKTNAMIEGIELQECVYNLGVKSINENGMNNQINLINGDIKNIFSLYHADSFDTVISNPPYFNTGSDGFYNFNEVKKIARHEICLNLDDLFSAAFYLLKSGGNFAMVHRSERLIEIIEKLKYYKLEPKRIQFICPKKGRNSDLFLIESTKYGNSGIKVLPEVIIHNDDGSYCDNISHMFNL